MLLKAQEEENVPTITDTTIVEEVTGEDETINPDSYREDAGTSTDTYFYRGKDTLTVEQRNIPPAVVKKMKEDGDFWYVNTDLKGSQKKAEAERRNGKKGQKGKESAINEKDDGYTPIGQRSWFQALLWIIIVGGFATFLIIYLAGSNVGLFRKKNRQTSNGEEEQLITEDIFAINYQKEIDKAAKEGNYRMAIRLMFLRVLKNMSEKNIISYKQDKTNLDYLLEVRPSHYYNHFFRVTRNYEYSWYGLFPVSEDAYKLIRGDFDRFDKELR